MLQKENFTFLPFFRKMIQKIIPVEKSATQFVQTFSKKLTKIYLYCGIIPLSNSIIFLHSHLQIIHPVLFQYHFQLMHILFRSLTCSLQLPSCLFLWPDLCSASFMFHQHLLIYTNRFLFHYFLFPMANGDAPTWQRIKFLGWSCLY